MNEKEKFIVKFLREDKPFIESLVKTIGLYNVLDSLANAIELANDVEKEYCNKD